LSYVSGVSWFYRFARPDDLEADGLYAARFTQDVGEHIVSVPYGSQTARLRKEHRLGAPDEQVLIASNNENESYRLSLTYLGRRCPEMTLLLVDGAPIASVGSGGGSGRWTVDFALDRSRADSVSRILGVTRQDRIPIGERVGARFAPASTRCHREGPLVIVVHIENPIDAPAVSLETGGMRFFFVAYRGDECVAETQPGISTAPLFFKTLGAGDAIDDELDLAGRWLQTPGRHVIACRYETRIAAAGASPYDLPRAAAHVWDRTFVGSVEIEIF
jgi:hypothetical protein